MTAATQAAVTHQQQAIHRLHQSIQKAKKKRTVAAKNPRKTRCVKKSIAYSELPPHVNYNSIKSIFMFSYSNIAVMELTNLLTSLYFSTFRNFIFSLEISNCP